MVDIKKQIEESNAKYNAASKKEKRVMIFKDILKSIKAAHYIPNTDIYFRLIKSDKKEKMVADFNSELTQENLLSNQIKCKVCIKAAAIISKQRIGNSIFGLLDADDFYEGEKIENEISSEKWNLIEELFENNNWNKDQLHKYIANLSDKERMIKICNIIIKNDGAIKKSLFTLENFIEA